MKKWIKLQKKEKCKKNIKNNDIDKKNEDKIANYLTSIHSIGEKNSFIKTTFKSQDEDKDHMILL